MKFLKGNVDGYSYEATETTGPASPVVEYYNVEVKKSGMKKEILYRHSKISGCGIKDGIENLILELSRKW